MTVSYASQVANGSSFGCFWRVLLKWKGSVYKLVWRELLFYLCLYYAINFGYRYTLNPQQQEYLSQMGNSFNKNIGDAIPLSFILGFYVTLIVKRWWDQYKLLPWPDTLALYISAGIPGNDEKGRLMRRTIVRYAVLAYVVTLQRVSVRVKKRFPSLQHIVDSGLMMESEKKIFEIMDRKSPMSKYWMPLVWATNIINRARKETLITSDHIVQTLLIELSDIRRRLGALIGYDTVCVPLVYTQVATIAVYIYFLSSLFGNQFVSLEDEFPFPFFTVLQFAFYVGWLKVAEVLINPFGEDDDDIELNWLIDRHIKAAYMIVDEMHEEHPELLKDQYWEDVVPKDLPYTVASEQYRKQEPKGSAEKYKVKNSEAVYANIIPSRKLNDDTYADYESVDTPIIDRRPNWLVRQFSRVGSIRSSSTAYSSGNPFNRNRINSVYSNPEAGLPTPSNATAVTAARTSLGQIHQKMSFYDRFVNRKSLRNQKQRAKQNATATNGNIQKFRPRIPTPDVISDRDLTRTQQQTPVASEQAADTETAKTTVPATVGPQTTTDLASILSSTVPLAQHLNTSDFPMVQVVLAPIQESDSNGSVQNTLHAHQPNTTALAKSILKPTLTAIGLDSSTAALLANNPAVTLSIAPQSSTTAANLKSGGPPSPNFQERIIDRKISTTSQTSQQKRNEVYV